jgi:hypothetical protein
MVFWKTFPFYNWIQSISPTDLFCSFPFYKESIPSPTKQHFDIYTKFHPLSDLHEIRIFLKTFFGNPPFKPILNIPIEHLLSPRDFILVVRDSNKKIVGCVRQHYVGKLINVNKDIYLIDCLCIHPKWRKKGITDYLLTSLHRFANSVIKPNNIFLKEGNILPILQFPLYSGTYVYRELTCKVETPLVKSLSINQAYNYIDKYLEIYPNTLIISNKDSTNQYWRLYKNNVYSILVCFQDTFQYIFENGSYKKIGWITAWLENSIINDTIRQDASKQLSDSMYTTFDYIWINQEWTGKSYLWKVDGMFHWYSYQWSSSLKINKSYCILN